MTVDGWRDGRPCSLAFYDEDSAYWVDGMTRLAAILDDDVLLARVQADFDAVIANPDWFNATWTKGSIELSSILHKKWSYLLDDPNISPPAF